MTINHASFERSALREVTKFHISELVDVDDHFGRDACLLQPRDAKPQFAKVLQHIVGCHHAEACKTAQQARASKWDIIHRGDAVAAQCSDGSSVVGFVQFHGCVSAAAGVSSCVSCLKLLQLQSERGRLLTWTQTERTIVVPTAQIKSALVWAEVEEGKILTLKPLAQ